MIAIDNRYAITNVIIINNSTSFTFRVDLLDQFYFGYELLSKHENEH
jgi:hypothetical protein